MIWESGNALFWISDNTMIWESGNTLFWASVNTMVWESGRTDGLYKKRHPNDRMSFNGCGNYLTSRRGEPQVLSAQESLTSVFGMRTGGSSPLSSPQWLYIRFSRVIYLSAHAGFFPPASALSFFGGFPRLPYQSFFPRLTTA